MPPSSLNSVLCRQRAIPVSLPTLRPKYCQGPFRFRQHPEPLVERHGTADKNNVISKRPPDAQTPTRNLHGLRVLIVSRSGPGGGRSDRHTGLDPPPESWQAAPIAETVCQHDGGQRAGAQEEESRVPAEDGGVGELDHGEEEGRAEGRVGVGEGVLVEVVDVRDAEIERCQEDDVCGRDVGEEV